MKNGRFDHHDDEPGKVTSLSDARRRKEAEARRQRSTSAGRPQGPRTLRDWVIGGGLILMAVAMIAIFLGNVLQAVGGLTR